MRPGVTASGLRVNRLDIFREVVLRWPLSCGSRVAHAAVVVWWASQPYKPFKGVKYMTLGGDYQVTHRERHTRAHTQSLPDARVAMG